MRLEVCESTVLLGYHSQVLVLVAHSDRRRILTLFELSSMLNASVQLFAFKEWKQGNFVMSTKFRIQTVLALLFCNFKYRRNENVVDV